MSFTLENRSAFEVEVGIFAVWLLH